MANTAEDVDSLIARGVIFVVAGSGKDDVSTMFENVAVKKRASMTFARVVDLQGKWISERFSSQRPFVAKMEKGEPPVFAPAASFQSEETLLEWIEKERFPLVNMLNRQNFRSVTKTAGKMTVISIVNIEDDKQVQNAERMLKRLARPAKSPLNAEALQKFRFGILDGVKWERFISQFFIKPDMLPHTFVLDGYNERFYQDRKVDEEDEVETFLAAVAAGKIYAQREGVLGMPGRLMIAVWELDFEFLKGQPYLMLGLVLVIGVVLSAVVCIVAQCGLCGRSSPAPAVPASDKED
jgi:hypothetical protein